MLFTSIWSLLMELQCSVTVCVCVFLWSWTLDFWLQYIILWKAWIQEWKSDFYQTRSLLKRPLIWSVFSWWYVVVRGSLVQSKTLETDYPVDYYVNTGESFNLRHGDAQLCLKGEGRWRMAALGGGWNTESSQCKECENSLTVQRSRQTEDDVSVLSKN